MKILYVLVVVCLAAAGYFAYEEGKLASLHPLLDPASGDAVDSEESVELSQSDPVEPESESPETKAPVKNDAKAEEESAQARLEEEQKAAEAAAREREKQAEAEARANALAERNRKRDAISEEIKSLEAQRSALTQKVSQAKKNRAAQESKWYQESIKTPESEKEKLRKASDAFVDQIAAEMNAIDEQVRQKRAELRDLFRS